MRERQTTARAGQEAGFALILAILALMLLTFLGLTLALSTSTELQIATNYRWSQQALYNAEAGLELTRQYLLDADWRAVLPLPRGAGGMTSPPAWVGRLGPNNEPSRSFEMQDCDTGDPLLLKGNQGFGVVFELPNYSTSFQNTSTTPLGLVLNGAYTVWVRRPLQWDGATYIDDPSDNTIIVTVEGTAPFTEQNSFSAFGAANRAIRYLEATIGNIPPNDCDNGPQEGAGALGSGFDQCSDGTNFANVPNAVGERGGQ